MKDFMGRRISVSRRRASIFALSLALAGAPSAVGAGELSKTQTIIAATAYTMAIYQAGQFGQRYRTEYPWDLQKGEPLGEVDGCLVLNQVNTPGELTVFNACSFAVQRYTCSSDSCQRQGRVYQMLYEPYSKIRQWEAGDEDGIWCEDGAQAIVEDGRAQCVVGSRRN
jgi:hypothetical protein